MAWLKLGSNYLETAGTGSAAGACQHPQRQQLRYDIDNDNEEKDEEEEEDNLHWFCRVSTRRGEAHWSLVILT